MEITLFTPDKKLFRAWKRRFADVEGMRIARVSLAKLKRHDAVALAGNSYGVMTGGIDLAARELFGVGLQDAIQNHILATGETIDVGKTLGIDFDDGGEDGKTPAPHGSIIYAPTMKTPRPAIWLDVAFAMAAIIMAANSMQNETVAIPGLGTGAGGLPEDIAAQAMRIGYDTAMAMLDMRAEVEAEDK